MSEIQALLIPLKYNKKTQNKIISEMKVNPIKKVHTTSQFNRYRINEPKCQLPGHKCFIKDVSLNNNKKIRVIFQT